MTSSRHIRKVIIPAAGLGTRFLPVTKVVPKEMLPIAGRPLIQLAVEEAVASGVDTIVFIVRPGKTILQEYFQRNLDLEEVLRRHGRDEDAEAMRRIGEMAEIRTVWQDAPLGLAHAIGCAESVIGDEPFAVILPDAVIDSSVPCLRQMLGFYAEHRGCVIATQQLHPSEIDRFGVLEVTPMPGNNRGLRVISLIERPAIGSVASHFGIFGRYLLEPDIFRSIKRTLPGFAGEIQLTDALVHSLATVPIYAYRFEGKHYDAGSKLGFLQATFAYALKDPLIAESLRRLFAQADLDLVRSN